ncbi:MAG: imidazole glycerol phosphate synthase subunit HisH [Hahellaceae bacterium]|nr:imidazole glycerol phosphate synthase subunit HisH [Hahellaceae bacterium]
MIAIVDYGLGNIKAFYNLYKRLDIDTYFARTEAELSKASKIILPGVGAFDHAMDKLNSSGLRDKLDQLVTVHSVPVLGICVGMQMMSNRSDEGVGDGLAWIPGNVLKFNRPESEYKKYPLPHMGWNNLSIKSDSPLVQGLDVDPKFYFLHSYYFKCTENAREIASADYCQNFSAIVSNENAFGIQCHPEKSHHNGVTLLKNFAEM